MVATRGHLLSRDSDRKVRYEDSSNWAIPACTSIAKSRVRVLWIWDCPQGYVIPRIRVSLIPVPRLSTRCFPTRIESAGRSSVCIPRLTEEVKQDEDDDIQHFHLMRPKGVISEAEAWADDKEGKGEGGRCLRIDDSQQDH
jgi:hypothetical protein